jgi:hypothetical protein
MPSAQQKVYAMAGRCVSYKFLSSFNVWSRWINTVSKASHCINSNVGSNNFMTREYKLDLRHQLKSFRQCFATLVWTMGAVVIGLLIIKGIDFWTIFTICILFWLATSVALTIPFHINYLVANWRTKLLVDDKLKTIRIVESGQTYEYNFADIKVTRHILGHFRPDRQKSWTPIPFDFYGYIKVKTSDNKVTYLTSLMLDPINPPVPVDKTEYGFPIIWSR